MKENLKIEFFSTLKTILIALILAFVIKNFIFTFAYVRGISMEPTLQEKNMLFSFVPKKYYGMDRGDIIVLKSPTEKNKNYIKRIIGLPGDEIQIKNGKVYINKELYNEEYISNSYTEALNATFVTLDKNEYFVMGDNRNPYGSIDSRSFGPIKKSSIKSVVTFRILPFSEFGSLRSEK